MLLCYRLTLVGWENRKERVKTRKLVSWATGDLISRRSVEEQRKKTKQVVLRQSLTSSHGWTSSQPVPAQRMLTYITPSSLFYCWGWHCSAWSISLVGSGHMPGCVPSQSLVHPNLVTVRQGEKQAALALSKHCSPGTSVCSQPCFGHPQNHSTVQAALKKRSFIPTRHSAYCYPGFSCPVLYIFHVLVF